VVCKQGSERKDGTMSKYHAKKTVVDGMVFDSLKEARRYGVLKAMEEAGEIQGLGRQVEFLLIPEQREPDTIGKRGGVHRGKLIERKITYVADFVYVRNHDNKCVVEDVKGMRTKDYIMKRKLMLFIHGIRITEV
jgi:hypothetical protein